ncbi:MAG: VirB4 family type IV secretion system protein [Bacillota bacterium]
MWRKKGAGEQLRVRGPSFEGGVTTLHDLVAPDGIYVERSHVQIGSGRYVRQYFVSEVPSQVFVGWLDDLYTAGDVDVSVYVYPIPDKEVIDSLTQQIINIQAQVIADEKRGDYRNLSVLRRVEQDAWALREQVQTNQNRMFAVAVHFSVAAKSLEELDRQCKVLEEKLGGRAVHVRQAFLRQADALRTVMPLGDNRMMDVYRNFDLYAATALFPWSGADVVHPEGVLLGMNLVTGAPVFYDSFIGPPLLQNPHLGVVATSGAGKTTFLKVLAARSAVLGVRTVFLDPEGEYGDLVRAMGGVYVRLTPDADEVYVNPFDLEPEQGEDGSYRVPVLDKVSDVKSLVAVLLQSAGERLTPEEGAILEEAVREEYGARGITQAPESLYEKRDRIEGGRVYVGPVKKEMPTFSSLYERLGKYGERAERLRTVLKPCLRGGSLGFFDGQSSIRLGDALLVAFDVSRLEESIARPFAMHVCLEWVWEAFVKKNPLKGPKQKLRVVVDEGWLFEKYEDTASFLELMARRARKRNCSLVVATQHFCEFQNPKGQATMGNLDSVFLMKQNATEFEAVCEFFKLAEGQRDFLRTCGTGQGLLRVGSDRSQYAAVRVTVSENEWELLGLTQKREGEHEE